jgi:hypothetical protein
MHDRGADSSAAPQKLHRDTRKQLEEVQVLLNQRIQQARAIADSLIDLGNRLKSEPWRWVVGNAVVPPPPGSVSMPLEFDMVAALDKERLKRLLDEIRWLQREEARLLGHPVLPPGA